MVEKQVSQKGRPVSRKRWPQMGRERELWKGAGNRDGTRQTARTAHFGLMVEIWRCA